MPRTEDITGIVVNNKDPAKAGRIEASIPQMDGQKWPDWIDPVFPPHWFSPPAVGEEVDIVLPEGVESIEFAESIRYKGHVLNQSRPAPSVFFENYPNRRGFLSPTLGHQLIFDDKAGTVVLVNGKSGDSLELDATSIVALSQDVRLGEPTANPNGATALCQHSPQTASWTSLGLALATQIATYGGGSPPPTVLVADYLALLNALQATVAAFLSATTTVTKAS
jgi:hypothetical protein